MYPFSNDIMFSIVMSSDDVCRLFIEALFGTEVSSINEHRVQDTAIVGLGYKSIRYDVTFVGDNQVYHIEMQKVKESDLLQRARYYHAVSDVINSRTGMKYSELPNTYVVFICMFDPFKDGFAKYTQEPAIRELKRFVSNGAVTIYLNVMHEQTLDRTNVSAGMESMLAYLRDPEMEMTITNSELVIAVNDTVQAVNLDYSRRGNKMLDLDKYWEGVKAQGRAEGEIKGKAEGEAETLRKLKAMGLLPEDFVMPGGQPDAGPGVKPMKLGG